MYWLDPRGSKAPCKPTLSARPKSPVSSNHTNLPQYSSRHIQAECDKLDKALAAGEPAGGEFAESLFVRSSSSAEGDGPMDIET